MTIPGFYKVDPATRKPTKEMRQFEITSLEGGNPTLKPAAAAENNDHASVGRAAKGDREST